MVFVPNNKFRKKYNRLFRKDPEAANLWLLITELASEEGRVETSPEELAILFAARFEDPKEYALGGTINE